MNLAAYRVQRLEPGGINYEPAGRQVVVWGIHADDTDRLITGIKFGNTVLTRIGSPAKIPGGFNIWEGEQVEALRIRAMRDVVPSLPGNALRDSKGKPVGYFIYAGLPEDHCKAIAEQEGSL